MKDLVIVACNVLDLSYKNLKLYEILKENGFSLDDISSDLISILNNTNDSLIRLQSLEIDISGLAIGSDIEFTSTDFYSEIDNIMMNIIYRLNQFQIKGTKLVAIHFEEPDSIFFTFI